MAWHGEAKTLWIDLDDDGRFSEREKWTLSSKPIEIPLRIDERPRVMLLRARGETPLIAIRGFVEGQVSIEGQQHRVYLSDGGADGCFNKVGIDRIWLDINRDGKIDPLFEIFPAGSGIEIAKVRYLLKPNSTGETIEVFRRPTETGEVAFTLMRAAKTPPKQLVVNLVSEWGEWIQIKEIGSLMRLPVGRYRIVDLGIQLEEDAKKRWAYHFFATESKFDLEVRAGEKRTYELLPQLKLQFLLEEFAKTKGAMVRPWIAASNGLTMDSCDHATAAFFGAQDDAASYHWRGEKAVIRLNDAGSVKLDEQDTGFH